MCFKLAYLNVMLHNCLEIHSSLSQYAMEFPVNEAAELNHDINFRTIWDVYIYDLSKLAYVFQLLHLNLMATIIIIIYSCYIYHGMRSWIYFAITAIFCRHQRSALISECLQRATQQLRAINQFGDNIYVPIAPSTAQVNLQLNEECDPAYNQELYLDSELVTAGLNQLRDGCVTNNGHINDDDMTANCLSRHRFTDTEFEVFRELLIR